MNARERTRITKAIEGLTRAKEILKSSGWIRNSEKESTAELLAMSSDKLDNNHGLTRRQLRKTFETISTPEYAFCAIGAAKEAHVNPVGREALDRVAQRRMQDEFVEIWNYNDDVAENKGDVLSAFDEAIGNLHKQMIGDK